jgi:hypothetical protein
VSGEDHGRPALLPSDREAVPEQHAEGGRQLLGRSGEWHVVGGISFSEGIGDDEDVCGFQQLTRELRTGGDDDVAVQPQDTGEEEVVTWASSSSAVGPPSDSKAGEGTGPVEPLPEVRAGLRRGIAVRDTVSRETPHLPGLVGPFHRDIRHFGNAEWV